jgi:branched-chain amino acid transport system permease protein
MLIHVVISGIATGCIYSLMALGLTLIYKATEHVNFAQGDMAMLSGFVAFTLFGWLKLPLPLAFFLTLLFAVGLGLVMEFLLVKPAIGAPHFNVFIITLGASIVLQSASGLIWSHDQFPFPSLFPDKNLVFGPIQTDAGSVGIIMTTLALMLILFLFFKYTKVGTSLRAVSQSHQASLLMGVSVKHSFALAWAISGLVSGIAAFLIAPVVFLSTQMGLVVINGFAAGIMGGWGSFPGAVIGGISLGVLENIAPYYFPSQIKSIIPFAVLVAVLVIRPTGIMGEKRQRRV